MSAQEVHFPTEEEGGAFHGAGSGGAEPVSPKATGLARADSLGLDKAAGVRRAPGTARKPAAGAHPAMISGGGSGVGVGGDESPPTATSPKAAHEEEGGQEGQGLMESAKEAVASAAQSAKDAVGL